MDSFFIPIIVTGIFTGMGMGLLGVYIVGMRMPFIGSCISHTAMVGAVYASLLDLNPTVGAIIMSMVGSGGAALIRPDRKRFDANTGQAILLAFMMGFIFLAVGLEQDSRSEMLSLLWGNVLLADWGTVWTTGALTLVLLVFSIAFNQELKAILFSRSLATVTGVYTNGIYFCFLCLCGLLLAVNLKAVGGLLIFSLLVCPASAAYRVCRGHRAVILCAMLFGILSTVLGFAVSYLFNLPTGACTVIVSALIFAVTGIWHMTS
jgi:manganese/iron transport system permease protein